MSESALARQITNDNIFLRFYDRVKTIIFCEGNVAFCARLSEPLVTELALTSFDKTGSDRPLELLPDRRW